MTRPPDHTDADGDWWALTDLPRWWGRHDADRGVIVARHRAGELPDVTVRLDAEQPVRLLAALCGSAEFKAAHPDLSP